MRMIIPGFASFREAWVIYLGVTFLEPLFYVSKAILLEMLCVISLNPHRNLMRSNFNIEPRS